MKFNYIRGSLIILAFLTAAHYSIVIPEIDSQIESISTAVSQGAKNWYYTVTPKEKVIQLEPDDQSKREGDIYFKIEVKGYSSTPIYFTASCTNEPYIRCYFNIPENELDEDDNELELLDELRLDDDELE